MAKSKETSVPLIFALVFFVLTTIAFGVMWYLSFSEMETHVNTAKTAKKDLDGLRAERDEAVRLARVYRIYLGIPRVDPPFDDVNTINTEAKPGDKIAAEVKLINEALATKLASNIETEKVETKDFLEKKMPGMTLDELKKYVEEYKKQDSAAKMVTLWTLDGNGKAEKAPSKGLIDHIADIKNRDSAYTAADDERKNYKSQIAVMVADVKKLQDATAAFNKAAADLPDQITKDIKAAIAQVIANTKKFEQAVAERNDELKVVKERLDTAERNLRKEQEKYTLLQDENQKLVRDKTAGDRETFTFDEPQGKILRKVPGSEGVVEINLGSAVGIRPGLTFTILPTDFPEKGRQSRVRMLRVPDGKGAYKSVETFVPKGSIEVFEVVNERLSLARIQAGSELDPIRDGIAQGDLLYNSVWRKGVADHIALVGIFDTNGDGIDDIETVVRDLTKMGIPVDAYFDMKKRAWVGTVTERTRYVVKGYFPLNALNDPNRDEKTKLLAALSQATDESKKKGVSEIDFRDFFGRMGYKFRLDVTDDKVNQATAPYLSNVGVGGVAPPPPPGNP